MAAFTSKLLFEYGDLAANTLLVLDAKRSVLLTGNYSRVGFNHPGPAFFYVMAAGEYLFHDLLHLTPTPMGGQFLGTAALNAGWLSLLWFLLGRFSRSAGAATLGLAAFVAYTLLNEPGFLFGVWMPFLYFAPFAVFTLALARVTSGRLDALVPLALATGFLVHGHASFIGITGLMIVIGALVHVSATRWLPPEVWPKLLSPETVVQNRGHLIAAAVIMVVFLLPPLAQTVLHFPGPLGQYAGYGGGRHSNPLAASLTYVFACWGGAPMLIPSLVLMALLLTLSGGDRRELGERLGFAAVLVASTLAVLFYTVFAIDFLDQAYIIYFYRAVPGLLAAVTATALYSALAGIWPRGRLTLVGLLCVSVLLAFGSPPADRQRRRHSRGVSGAGRVRARSRRAGPGQQPGLGRGLGQHGGTAGLWQTRKVFGLLRAGQLAHPVHGSAALPTQSGPWNSGADRHPRRGSRSGDRRRAPDPWIGFHTLGGPLNSPLTLFKAPCPDSSAPAGRASP